MEAFVYLLNLFNLSALDTTQIELRLIAIVPNIGCSYHPSSE